MAHDYRVTVVLSPARIAQALATAFELEVPKWAHVTGVTPPTGGTPLRPPMMSAGECAAWPGGEVYLVDRHATKQHTHVLNAVVLKRGLVRMLAQHAAQFGRLLTGDTADGRAGAVLVQCAIFGEVLYD